MRKFGLENSTQTEHSECEQGEQKWQITYLSSLYKWMSAQRLEGIPKRQKLLRATKIKEVVEIHDWINPEETRNIK